MVVFHTFKPSSLAHSLQIHCVGLPGLRLRAAWAWPGKRVPTTTYFKNQIVRHSDPQAHWGLGLRPNNMAHNANLFLLEAQP